MVPVQFMYTVWLLCPCSSCVQAGGRLSPHALCTSQVAVHVSDFDAVTHDASLKYHLGPLSFKLSVKL